MSIIDKARETLQARDLQRAEMARIAHTVMHWQEENSHKRAKEFAKSLGLKTPFSYSISGGVITVRYRQKPAVTITFGWDSSNEYENAEYVGQSEPFEWAWIIFAATWLPRDAQSYKTQKAGVRDNFYPNSDEDLHELGEYLLRVQDEDITLP